MHLRTALGGLILTTICLAGCESDPARVEKKQVAEVRNAATGLRVGMSRDDALAAIEFGNTVKLSTTSVKGAEVDEWKVEAYHDDDWNKRRDLFVTFLYFVDGRLVDVSDKRLSVRDNPELVDRWTSEG